MAAKSQTAPSIHCPNATPAAGKQGMLRISFLPAADGSVDETKLVVTFIQPIATTPFLLEVRSYSMTGGQRIFPRIVSVEKYPPDMPHDFSHDSVVLKLNEVGDFSVYTLTVNEPEDGQELDPFFASKKLRFRVQCDDPFDCRPPEQETPAPKELAVAIDYLTKDYAGFRQALLEFVPTRLPAWTERSEADIGMMLLELFAATADTLSYMQDRVANEAFLDSAGQRRSVAGHLALIDYEMDQGSSAFAWLQFQVNESVKLPKDRGLRVRNKPVRDIETIIVFETHGDSTLLPEYNELPVYAATNADCCLPKDALSLMLAGNYANLKKGYHVLLDDGVDQRDIVRLSEVVSTSSGNTILKWTKATPLRYSYCVRPFDPDLCNGVLMHVDLCKRTITVGLLDNRSRFVEKRLTVGTHADITLDGKAAPLEKLTVGLFVQYQLSVCQCFVVKLVAQSGRRLVVRGNLVPATHGETVEESLLDLQKPTAPKNQPELDRLLDRGLRLRRGPLAYYDRKLPIPPQTKDPTEPSTRQPPRSISTLKVNVGNDEWLEKPTLLYSAVHGKDFRVEIDDQGNATIRFGKKKLGFGSRPVFDFKEKTPSPTTITATYRVGGGVAGNVAAATLVDIQPHEKQAPAGIVSVTNPLPATGGRDLESRDHARRFAPADFKKPLVALTAADYQAAAAEFLFEETRAIQRANAAFRWTGSWLTATLALDPFQSDLPAREEQDRQKRLREGTLAFLNFRRLAGYDLEVAARALYVPLELNIRICLKQGVPADVVERGVLEALGAIDLPGGRKGFFHPDNFTFGQPLYVSRLFAAIAAVPGVAAAHITRLCRFRALDFQKQTDENLARGYVRVAADEILRLDNNRNFPENGTIAIQLLGGGP